MIALLRRLFCLKRIFDTHEERVEIDNVKKQISEELHEIARRVHTIEWQADVKRRQMAHRND